MTATAKTHEVLIARKRPWLSRLWVRVTLVLSLVFAICLVSWWWPRRGMVAVWRVGGEVRCEADRSTAIRYMQGLASRGWSWDWFDLIWKTISSSRRDDEITCVALTLTAVDHGWLTRIKRFPNLEVIYLNGNQIGSGLDQLRELKKLRRLHVTNLSQPKIAELKRLPNLEEVGFWKCPAVTLDLEELASLTRLNYLIFDHCEKFGDQLRSLPLLSSLKTLIVQSCTDFEDGDLANLQQCPALNFLDLVDCGPIGDEGLRNLSKLSALELLAVRHSSKNLTNEGLDSLRQLKQLKDLIFLRNDLTAKQVDFVQETLPNVVIKVN